MRRAVVERAAREYFAEGYEYLISRRMLESTPAEFQGEARRKIFTPRTVPDGCFVWISYLIWLEKLRDVSPYVSLLACEAEGLMIVKQERERFKAAHPPCPYCGMPNEEHALRCTECMKELNRG